MELKGILAFHNDIFVITKSAQRQFYIWLKKAWVHMYYIERSVGGTSIIWVACALPRVKKYSFVMSLEEPPCSLPFRAMRVGFDGSFYHRQAFFLYLSLSLFFLENYSLALFV